MHDEGEALYVFSSSNESWGSAPWHSEGNRSSRAARGTILCLLSHFIQFVATAVRCVRERGVSVLCMNWGCLGAVEMTRLKWDDLLW